MPPRFVDTTPLGISSRSAHSDVSDSSQSLDVKDLKQQRRRNKRHVSDKFFRGRRLAPDFGASPETLNLKFVTPQKRRYIWQRDRLDIGVSKGGEGPLEHYGGGTRVHLAQGFFVVRNSAGKPVIKCVGDRKKYIVYGTRPMFAGSKAEAREGGIPFYPWFQVRMCSDGTVSVELNRNYQSVWYSEQTLAEKTITMKSSLDDEVAAVVYLQDNQVSISPKVDPAVMLCLALILDRMATPP